MRRIFRTARAKLGWILTSVGVVKWVLDAWGRWDVLKELASYHPILAQFLAEGWVTPTVFIVGLGIVVWAALDRGGTVGFDNLRFLPAHYRRKRIPHEYIVGGAIIGSLVVFGAFMHKRTVVRNQIQLTENIHAKAEATTKVQNGADNSSSAQKDYAAQPNGPSKTRHAPEVLLLYREKTIEIHNPGPGTLYLWGGAYGDAKVPLDGSPPRVIVPGAYYYLFTDTIEDQFRTALAGSPDKPGTTTFHAFVTTEDDRKYTLRGILLGKVINGTATIHVQILPTIAGWTDAPKF